MTSLPATDFLSRLVAANRLDENGFSRLVFFEGMLFGSWKKWWGKPGVRPFSHEGLDLCFFDTAAHGPCRLDETVGVPLLYDGRVANITDDFLGRTVIFQHDFPDHPSLLSLYGHLNPDRNLKIGDRLRAGEIFARIAGFEKKGLVPHMHLSLTDPRRLPPPNLLEWEFLNNVDRDVFVDPLAVIRPEYRVIPYDEFIDLAESVASVSSAGTHREAECGADKRHGALD